MAFARYKQRMPTEPVLNPEDLTAIKALLDDQDDLLADAVRRVEQERSGDIKGFFKHGEHGSHNSGG